MSRTIIGLKLFMIASLSGALLFFVNRFTAPIIDQVQAERAQAMYASIFEELDTFEQVDVLEGSVQYQVKVYDVTNEQIGTIYSVSANNDYGTITMLIGFDSDDMLSGYEFSFSSQTPTYFAKVNVDSFKANLISRPSSDTFDDVDVKVGATYSATTTKALVQAAAKYHEGVK